MFVYLILDAEDRIPILISSSPEKLKRLLHEYMGVSDSAEYPKYLGYEKFDDRGYYSIYEGSHRYHDGDSEVEFLQYYLPVDVHFN